MDFQRSNAFYDTALKWCVWRQEQSGQMQTHSTSRARLFLRQDPIRIIRTVLPSFRAILDRRAKISSSSTGSRILLNYLLENVMLKQRGLTYSSPLHNDSRVKKWNTFRLLVLTLCLQIKFFVIIFIFPAKKVLFLWIWINERVSFISLKIKQKCLKVIFFFRILEIVLDRRKVWREFTI